MARFEITSQGQLDKLLAGIAEADDLRISRARLMNFDCLVERLHSYGYFAECKPCGFG